MKTVEQQDLIALDIAKGEPTNIVLKRHGLTQASLSNMRKKERFKSMVEHHQHKLFEAVRSRVRMAASKALETLEELCDDADTDKVRMESAKAILNASGLGGQNAQIGVAVNVDGASIMQNLDVEGIREQALRNASQETRDILLKMQEDGVYRACQDEDEDEVFVIGQQEEPAGTEGPALENDAPEEAPAEKGPDE